MVRFDDSQCVEPLTFESVDVNVISQTTVLLAVTV
jgi:hypothetical protein